MRIGTVLGSYLKAADLGGKPLAVTITTVKVEDVGDDQKPVIYFDESHKGLVLNRTNADSLTELFGTDETDAWTGKSVALLPAKTMFGGKKVDCIRIGPRSESNGRRDPAADDADKYPRF